MPWLTIDGLLDGMDLYNDALVAFADEHGVPVINDRSSIPGDSQHFVDWAHFSDAGAERMAQRFAGFIGERGLLMEALERARGE